MSDGPTLDGPVASSAKAPDAAPAPGRLPERLDAIEQLREALHRRLGDGLAPLARLLGRAGVTPNQVSAAGAALTVAAAALIASGRPSAGGWLFLIASAFDLLDGVLARETRRASPFGAFLDSALDRVSEGAVLAAIAYVFAAQGRALDAAGVVLALLLSQLVSYARARAEGLGLDCRVGAVTRAERVVLLAAGLVSGLVAPAVWLIAAASALTVAQRVIHTARALERGPRAARR